MQSRHKAVIQDCEAILARGMGRGACLHLREGGIEPCVAGSVDSPEVVRVYQEGKFIDHSERLHQPIRSSVAASSCRLRTKLPIWKHIDIERVTLTAEEAVMSNDSDHGGVIRAQGKWRHAHFEL